MALKEGEAKWRAAFQELIRKRVYNFSYLSRAHGVEGEAAPHWMNILRLEADDLTVGQGAGRWLPLGMAIGDSLDMDIEPFVERLVGIFEYMNADMRYKSSVDKITKFLEKSVEYTGDLPDLNPVKLPFSLSYTETIFMVCDLMGQVYEKLGKSPVNIIDQEQFRNQVERLDTLVRNSILDRLGNNLNSQCAAKAQQMLYSIDSLYALNRVRHF